LTDVNVADDEGNVIGYVSCTIP